MDNRKLVFVLSRFGAQGNFLLGKDDILFVRKFELEMLREIAFYNDVLTIESYISYLHFI